MSGEDRCRFLYDGPAKAGHYGKDYSDRHRHPAAA